MASIATQTVVDAGDDFETEATGWAPANEPFVIAGRYGGTPDIDNGAFHFPTVPDIASKNTVDLATLGVEVDNTNTGLDVNVHFEDADDAEAIGSGTTVPSARSLTTAFTNYTSLATGALTITVTSGMQEVVNRDGWAADNDMTVLIMNNAGSGYGYIQIDDIGRTYAAPVATTLDADFTADAGVATVFDFPAPVLGGAAITVGDGTSKVRHFNVPVGEYATEFWLVPDSDANRAQRVDALPAIVTFKAGTISASSSEP
jgi:hypothetical protein